MKREIIKASAEHEAKFRKTWRLRDDVKDDPTWLGAYEHAATHKLYGDEMSAIGPVLVRRTTPVDPQSGPARSAKLSDAGERP